MGGLAQRSGRHCRLSRRTPPARVDRGRGTARSVVPAPARPRWARTPGTGRGGDPLAKAPSRWRRVEAGAGGRSEVGGLDDDRLGEEGDDPHLPAAARAQERKDLATNASRRCPRARSRAQGVRLEERAGAGPGGATRTGRCWRSIQWDSIAPMKWSSTGTPGHESCTTPPDEVVSDVEIQRIAEPKEVERLAPVEGQEWHPVLVRLSRLERQNRFGEIRAARGGITDLVTECRGAFSAGNGVNESTLPSRMVHHRGSGPSENRARASSAPLHESSADQSFSDARPFILVVDDAGALMRSTRSRPVDIDEQSR